MTDLADIRYQLISPLLRRYKRRFTLLDLGAGINPYMAQRISQEFDAVVVAIEQDVIVPEELAKFGPRALWLRKKMSTDDLERLSCCENFDTTLALNILHHYDCEWELALHDLLAMSDWVIAQTPYMSDMGTCGTDITPQIHEHLLNEGDLIGEATQFDKHCPRPIFLLKSEGEAVLTMSSWTSPPDCIQGIVHSSFTCKEIELRHKNRIGTYIHGLNLWNFANLGGAWPRKAAVLKLIREFPLPAERHGDITPHNFLFDGAELHLIDGHEGWEFDDAAGLKKTEEMVGDTLQ